MKGNLKQEIDRNQEKQVKKIKRKRAGKPFETIYFKAFPHGAGAFNIFQQRFGDQIRRHNKKTMQTEISHICWHIIFGETIM